MSHPLMMMRASLYPTSVLGLTNCAIINPDDFPHNVEHIEVTAGPSQRIVFTTRSHRGVPRGTVDLFSRNMDRFFGEKIIEVRPYCFDPTSNSESLSTIVLEADFLQKEETITLEPYDTEQMAKEFLKQFSGQPFTVGQQLTFQFEGKSTLSLVVKSVEAAVII